MTTWLTIAEINRMDRGTFVERLGGLFEGEPWMVALAWAARPFADRGELERALVDAVQGAPEERRVALLRAHPDLVGRAALAGTLTPESTGEQVAAGLDPDRLDAAEIARFTALNRAYRERFDFPFVICAREHRKAQILAGFEARLRNSREQEIATATAEVERICHYRLRDLVEE